MNFHKYKIIIVQEIKHMIIRFKFFRIIQNNYQIIHNNTYMSDEDYFYLNGDVNKQNCSYWAQTIPREIHQRALHCPKITVWCASSSEITRPHFFEKEFISSNFQNVPHSQSGNTPTKKSFVILFNTSSGIVLISYRICFTNCPF